MIILPFANDADFCVLDNCKSPLLASNENAVEVISILSDLICSVLPLKYIKLSPSVAVPNLAFPPPSNQIPLPAVALVAEPNAK